MRFDCTGSHNTVVPALGRRILSLNSRIKLMSMCISTAQARPKRLSRSWGAAFLLKFSHKTALVTCPCVFQLRKLAQSLQCDFGARHFSFQILHKAALLARCPCAFRLRRHTQHGCPGPGAPRYFILSSKFSHKAAFVTYPCAFRISTAQAHKTVVLLVPPMTILQEFHGALFLTEGPDATERPGAAVLGRF